MSYRSSNKPLVLTHKSEAPFFSRRTAATSAMKALLGKHCLCLAAMLLCGCAYRAMIYAPKTMSADDHVQNAEVFIYRDALQAQLTLYKYKKSVTLQILFTKISPSAEFTSGDFYIESNREIFRPITSLRAYSKIGDKNPIDTLVIQQGKILAVEFGEEVQSLDSFELHMPAIVTGGGQKVPNLDTIAFTKKKVWRAVSPL